MHSSSNSYHRSSSTFNSNLNSRYGSPSNYLDLHPSVSGSDRAEFYDRYQNRVNENKNIH